jgi:hypothetical protein
MYAILLQHVMEMNTMYHTKQVLTHTPKEVQRRVFGGDTAVAAMAISAAPY